MSLNNYESYPGDIPLKKGLDTKSPPPEEVKYQKFFEPPRYNYITQKYSCKTFYYVALIILLTFIAVTLIFQKNCIIIDQSPCRSCPEKSMHHESSSRDSLSNESPISSSESSIYISSLAPVESSKEDSIKESPHNCKLFVYDANQITMYDLKTNKSSFYREFSQDITAFDIVNSSIFFIEKIFL